MSIQSYGNRATKRFARGDRRYLPADHADKIEHLLLLLNRASSPEALRLPGLRLHRLEPMSAELYAVEVDNRYRLVFRFEDGNAYDVRVVDYHRS